MPERSAPVGGIPFAPGSLPRHHMFRNRRSRIANAQLMDDINSSGLKRQGDPLLPEQSDWSPATPDEAVYGRSRSYTARGDRSTLEKTAHLAGRADLRRVLPLQRHQSLSESPDARRLRQQQEGARRRRGGDRVGRDDDRRRL